MQKPNNYSVVMLTLAFFLFFGARGFTADETLPVIDGKKAVASVNEEPISLEELNRAIAASHTSRPRSEKAGRIDYSAIMDRLINTRLILLEARNMGLDELPEIKAVVEKYSREALMELLLKSYVRDISADEAEIERLYKERVKEWKLKSIRFKKATDARKVESQLKAGGDFDGVVKKAVEWGIAEADAIVELYVDAEKADKVIQVNGSERDVNFQFGPQTNATIVVGCDNLGGGNAFFGTIDEVRLYDTALAQDEFADVMFDVGIPPEVSRAPKPKNQQKDVPPDFTLRWRPGMYATTHDLYFGERFNDVNDAGPDDPRGVLMDQGMTDTQYDPPGYLDFAKTYYWRVDEVNEMEPNSPWKGSVWSFTVADFLVIDDFEAYTDFEPNRIYDVWGDGWQDNANGSVVGHTGVDVEAGEHYAETEIVPDGGGKQSMPFSYDNDHRSSEVTLSLPADRTDWVQHGTDRLNLWFIGYAGYVGGFEESPAGTFTITGGGSDIWSRADECHFAYKEASGSVKIIAKVESVENVSGSDGWSKAGVMIRESLEPGAVNTGVFVTPENGVRFQYRQITDDATSREFEPNLVAPQWVRLERTSGGLVRAYHSGDGSQWTRFPIMQVRMQEPLYVGLAVSSHSPGVPCTARFTNVEFDNSADWSHQDIGVQANDADRMYVSLNGGAAVVYHPDPAVTQTNTWTQWSIPLEDFAGQGIDMSHIADLSIGVGTRGDTATAGGTGVMYFDDIRLYVPTDSNAL